MPNQIYEGRVKVDGKKADGSQLIISKGDRQGEPYYKVSFKVGEAWVNLMDFDGVTRGQGGDYRVEYYQKFQPNGEPELYNGKPQYALVDIQPLGGATPSAAPAQASAPAVSEPRVTTSVIQTCVNAGVTITAALVPHMTNPESADLTGMALEMAERFKRYFETGKVSTLAEAVEVAAEGLDATYEDDDGVPF